MGSSIAEVALEQTVVAEAQAVEQFVELLKLEHDSLRRGDTDALAGHAEQKLKFADQLNELAAQRNAALAALGFGSDRAGADAWCAQRPEEEIATKAWATILALAGEARELNRLNGELIRLRMQFNAKALEALRGGASSLDLYGPDGQATVPGQQRINHSV